MNYSTEGLFRVPKIWVLKVKSKLWNRKCIPRKTSKQPSLKIYGTSNLFLFFYGFKNKCRSETQTFSQHKKCGTLRQNELDVLREEIQCHLKQSLFLCNILGSDLVEDSYLFLSFPRSWAFVPGGRDLLLLNIRPFWELCYLQ